ncbi:MAG: methionyl-tRNA formyltransferase, partial [Clostridia bacterium]|nr:methionyl-tRNA formyltransferase [Clostridia bacterium]
GIDTGDMLLRAVCPIGASDTAGGLLTKKSHIGAELLLETLARLADGDCPRERQEEAAATYEPMLTKAMGMLDFGEGVQTCLRRIRAMDPWPCAYACLDAGALKIWTAREALFREACPPGIILQAGEERGLVVSASDGAIELLEIQAPGGKRMEARSFLRGHELPAGIRLDEVRL